MRKYIFRYCILILMLLGCKNNENMSFKKPDVIEVLKVLHDDLIFSEMKYSAFPVPPPHPSINLDSIIEENKKKDTLKVIRDMIKRRGRLIVGIDTVLYPLHNKNLNKNYFQKCLEQGFENLYYSFKAVKDSVNIDVTRIPNNEYSYILPYQNYYKDFPRKGFDKYNVIIKFSRVAFNKNKTKASVIMGVSFGRLNGFSAIYFLEKKKDKWMIKCEKGLSIS